MNVLEWWNNLHPLTEEESKILEKGLGHDLSLMNEKVEKTKKPFDVLFLDNTIQTTTQEKFDLLTDEYFKRMPSCNCNHANRNLSFNISCTSFIKLLFDKYVDDNTLVITSDVEHPNVKEIVSNCKNKMILSHYDIIRTYNINYVLENALKYDKVFVYIIGTRNDTGEVTPQQFFEDLKEAFKRNNIIHKIVLDDVQGMFVIPRDYTLYDFVLGTAHAMIENYDMGIMISKEDIGGYKAYNWGKEYLKRIDILLKRKEKMNIFKQVLEQYYDKNRIENNERKYANILTSPAIFYLKLENDIEVSSEISKYLNDINILIADSTVSKQRFIRLRSHWFFLDTTLLPKVIKVMDYILNTKNKNLDLNIIKELVC